MCSLPTGSHLCAIDAIALIGENDTDRQGKKHKKRIRNDRRKVIMKPELMEEKNGHFHIFAGKATVKEQLVKQ